MIVSVAPSRDWQVIWLKGNLPMYFPLDKALALLADLEPEEWESLLSRESTIGPGEMCELMELMHLQRKVVT